MNPEERDHNNEVESSFEARGWEDKRIIDFLVGELVEDCVGRNVDDYYWSSDEGFVVRTNRTQSMEIRKQVDKTLSIDMRHEDSLEVVFDLFEGWLDGEQYTFNSNDKLLERKAKISKLMESNWNKMSKEQSRLLSRTLKFVESMIATDADESSKEEVDRMRDGVFGAVDKLLVSSSLHVYEREASYEDKEYTIMVHYNTLIEDTHIDCVKELPPKLMAIITETKTNNSITYVAQQNGDSYVLLDIRSAGNTERLIYTESDAPQLGNKSPYHLAVGKITEQLAKTLADKVKNEADYIPEYFYEP